MDADNPPVHTEPDTEAWLGAECLGLGVLRIGEARLAWAGPGRQFALPYPSIYVHAIAKGGQAAFPKPHLLLMAECGSDVGSVEEVRLCPAAADRLPDMFAAMSRCQTAHSDNGGGGGGGVDEGLPDDFVGDEGDEGEPEGDEDGFGEDGDGDGPDFDHLLRAPGNGGGGCVDGEGDQAMDTDQFEDAP